MTSISKQNASSLEKSTDWLHKDSCMQTGPIFSWCALGGLYSKDLFAINFFLLVAQATKMTKTCGSSCIDIYCFSCVYCIARSKRNSYKYIQWIVSSDIYLIILHGNVPTQTNIETKQQNMVSGVGDLTFTGLVFSWLFH